MRSVKSNAQTPGLFLLTREEAFSFRLERLVHNLCSNTHQERRDCNRGGVARKFHAAPSSASPVISHRSPPYDVVVLLDFARTELDNGAAIQTEAHCGCLILFQPR